MNFHKYVGFNNIKITHGGDSRNNAIQNFIIKSDCEMFMFYQKNILMRLISGFYVTFRLMMCKNQKIFMHYSFFPHFFTQRLISNLLVLKIIFFFFRKIDKENELFIEVNDLPYEQAIDLELTLNNLNRLDNNLFGLKNSHFVFASALMRSYITEKYFLKDGKSSVLINGGPISFSKNERVDISNSDIISLVYAGTLNRGRQIELLINIFNNSKNYLYLLGDGGEWIDELENLSSNIRYIGSMDEDSAHAFVAKCDVGLLPYDDSRFYYNICFPTKASFYLTAGIPFISTHLKEMHFHFHEDVVIYKGIDDWRDLIESVSFRMIVLEMKKNVSKISHKYEWQYLIRDWINNIELLTKMNT